MSKKLTKEQKRMIEVLQLAHDNITLGLGLCLTLEKLYGENKIDWLEKEYTKHFMRRYFKSKSRNALYWLSDYSDRLKTRDTNPSYPEGLQLRKDLLLNAIEFIKATGITV